MVNLTAIGKAIGAFLLALFILSTVFVYGLSQITEYDSLKPVFTESITDQINNQFSQNQDEFLRYINAQCRSSDTLVLSVGNITLNLDCKELLAKAPEKIPEYLSEKIFQNIYYKKYDCSALQCLTKAFSSRDPQELTVIISSQTNEFLKSLLPYLIAGIIISILIIIVSIRKLFEILKAIGITLIISGIAFIVILLSESFLPTADGALGGFIKTIVNTFAFLYGIVFAIGIVLTIIGYLGSKYYNNEEKKKSRKKY